MKATKVTIAVLAGFLAPTLSAAAITLDAGFPKTFQDTVAGGANCAFTYTTGGTNRQLVIVGQQETPDGQATPATIILSSLTWTARASVDLAGRGLVIFTAPAPTVTTETIVVAWTLVGSSGFSQCDLYSFAGASGTFATVTPSGTGAVQWSQTVSADSYLVGTALDTDDTSFVALANTTIVQQFDDFGNSWSGMTFRVPAPTAGANTIGSSSSTAFSWIGASIEVKAAASGCTSSSFGGFFNCY